MRAEEIRALERLSLGELIRRALDLGCPIEALSDWDPSGRRLLRSADGIRIRIIDKTVERELADQASQTREMPTGEAPTQEERA